MTSGSIPPIGHPDPEEVLDLALGLVEPARQQALLEHLGGCDPCSTVLRARGRAMERARVETRPRRPRRRARRWLVPSLVAAAAVLFLLVLPRLREGPGPAVWLPVEEAPALRSEGLPPELRAGIEAYRAHDAVGAVAALQQARAAGVLDLRGRILLASAHELRGEPARAVELLGEIDLLMIPPPWRDRARGVLARSLAALGRTREAEEVGKGLEQGP